MLVPYSSMTDPNDPAGRTVKEVNMDRRHAIPIDTLVEVKTSTWHGGGACSKLHARLWVVRHDRDCDGSPLYALGPLSHCYGFRSINEQHGIAEEDLTVVELTDAVRDGEDILEWPEDVD